MKRNKLTKEIQPYRVSTVKYLSRLGLNNQEIGTVLGITREAVRKLLLTRRSKQVTINKN